MNVSTCSIKGVTTSSSSETKNFHIARSVPYYALWRTSETFNCYSWKGQKDSHALSLPAISRSSAVGLETTRVAIRSNLVPLCTRARGEEIRWSSRWFFRSYSGGIPISVQDTAPSLSVAAAIYLEVCLASRDRKPVKSRVLTRDKPHALTCTGDANRNDKETRRKNERLHTEKKLSGCRVVCLYDGVN